MRILMLIALSISLSLLAVTAWAQTRNARAECFFPLSLSPADFSEDQTFSQFQRVTKGMKPPKASHAPDPKFPELPPDAEPRGTVVMLVGVNAKGRVEARSEERRVGKK